MVEPSPSIRRALVRATLKLAAKVCRCRLSDSTQVPPPLKRGVFTNFGGCGSKIAVFPVISGLSGLSRGRFVNE